MPPIAAVAAEPATPPRSDLSVEQAVAEAHRSGKAVEATAAASGTDKVVAGPDGKITLTRSAVPSRKRVGDKWKALDATLVRNADGSVSPTLAEEQLRLSGGAGDPMAVLGSGGLTATIDTTMPLPIPELAGDTAVYREVLPGVDLQVTASITGGFSEVFIVKNAEAATNPELAKLSLRTKTTGVSLTSDEAGNITGKDRVGRSVLTAPSPLMWDSALAPGKSFRAPDGVEVNSQSRMPARSSLDGPGAGARTARVGAQVRSGTIELTPDRKLLTEAATYPVYIDPTFNWESVGPKSSGWATLPRQFPGTNYWKDTPDPLGRMQVGNSGEISSRTLVNFPMPNSTLAGATIDAATFKITQTRAWSCTASRVNIYAPASTLTSSNATWNSWEDKPLGSVVDHQTVAYGYNDSCRAHGVPFDVKSAIAANVSSGKKTQTFVLSASSESDTNGWKEFLETSPTLSITFNHKPNKPSGMTTSPATSCTAATPTVVGDGQVTLYAPVSDRNGSDLGVTFNLWKSSTPATVLASSNPDLTYKSGSTAVLRVPVDTLRIAAAGAVTKFSWRVKVTDFNQSSDWSTTCTFQFDASRPGEPTITPPAVDAAQIGSSITIPVSGPVTGPVPTGYLYQLNGGPYGTVSATAGAAAITVIPTRFTNTVTVTGLSVGGNIGDTADVTFNAIPAETALDNDFDGDNIADLVTVGGANNLAAGMWLATGKGTGALSPAATNIGARGNGYFLTGKPTDFTGAQIITGRFAGSGLQDALAYYPDADHAGAAVVLRGNGDGSTIRAQLDGTFEAMAAGTLTDERGLNPRQLANAGHPGGAAYPDLVGVSGDATNGYYITYYPNMGMVGGYGLVNILSAQTTPTGGTDWDTWTMATAQTTAGTAMFLWQRSTGKVYLWNDLVYDGDLNALSYTQHLLSTNWNAGQPITPHAADVDGDGVADLWAVGSDGSTTTWLVTDLTENTGTMAVGPGGRVLTGTHAWLLNDAADGPVTGDSTAKDSIGTLTATGSGAAEWGEGGLFSPHVSFAAAKASTLTTASPAVSTTADFTVSAWVKPTNAGGVVLSQDGPNGPGFRLWAEGIDASWRFAIPRDNTTSSLWAVAETRPNSVKLGVWTHLSASFKKSTGVLDLHVNGVDVATATLLTPWSATGKFRIGSQKAGGGVNGYFQGQIAEVSAFDQVVLYDIGNRNIRDFDGDLRSDVLGVRSDGKLYLYRGNGAGQFKSAGSIIGTGWGDFTAVLSPGDFTGDGFTDVIARRSDGKLVLYRGNGAGGWLNGTSPDGIGTGWNQFTAIFSPGDFDGDGKSDVIARKSDGTLALYKGNGAGAWLNGTDPYSFGTGWNQFTAIFSPGDFDGDGKSDVIARKSDGTLRLYKGNGASGWLNGTDPAGIGTGWDQFDAIFSPGDFNGDGRSDVLARKPDGTLRYYRGNRTGGWSNGTAPGIVGTGWHHFSKLF